MNLRLVGFLFISITLISCANPLGEDSQVDSSFSPGGDATAPSAPTNLSLSGNPTFAMSPTLSWTSSTDNEQIQGYKVGIGTAEGEDDVVSFTNAGDVTSYQFASINPLLDKSTNYYLVVKAMDTSGNESPVASSTSWSPGLASESGAYILPESPTYLADCDDYLNSSYYNNEGDGNYWLDVDGPGGMAAFIATCDMTTESGGWTLVLNYVHQGGSNPATNVKTITLPVLSSNNLGDDESGVSNSWGHAGNSLLTTMSFSAMRFYCVTSGHSRLMNFKTSLTGILSYVTSGTGTFVGVESNFTPLSGHNSNLPASRNSALTNQGDDALTNIPFSKSGTNHWSIRGLGGRWECDDFPGSDAEDTIHRVWVK
ncbi:MAG: fibronectin type III domain-containing protein [Bdellovibrionales bacterium]|nr:fibronectin type III domain-containing protein [Bdellovibrionales bacterium]